MWGQVRPLKLGEMEKAMSYDVGYTDGAEGISMRERYRLSAAPDWECFPCTGDEAPVALLHQLSGDEGSDAAR